MKKKLSLIVLAAVMLAPAMTIPTQAASSCTLRGTNSSDHLDGSGQRDIICTLDGNDYAHGNAAADELQGSAGSDTLVGGDGSDMLVGGKGPDELFGVDGVPNDVLNGGPGIDNCYGDKGDSMIDCEQRVRVEL